MGVDGVVVGSKNPHLSPPRRTTGLGRTTSPKGGTTNFMNLMNLMNYYNIYSLKN